MANLLTWDSCMWETQGIESRDLCDKCRVDVGLELNLQFDTQVAIVCLQGWWCVLSFLISWWSVFLSPNLLIKVSLPAAQRS